MAASCSRSAGRPHRSARVGPSGSAVVICARWRPGRSMTRRRWRSLADSLAAWGAIRVCSRNSRGRAARAMRWMRRMAVVAIASTAGCALQPGETRCSTTVVYGTAFTRCRSRPNDPTPDPEPETPPPRQRSASPPDQPTTPPQPPPAVVPRWWCVIYAGGRLGACYRNPSACEARRQSAVVVDPDTMPCRLQGPASCFGIAFVGQEGSDDSCHPTFAACNDQRDYVLAPPEQATALTMCRPID